MIFLCKFSLLVVLGFTFVYPEQGSAIKPIGLKFSEFGPSHVKGKYRYVDSLGLQFDIRPGLMQINSLNGKTIARYMKLARDTEYVQIADRGFLSRQNKQALVPTVIPKTRESLNRFAEERFSSDSEDFSDEDQLVREAHKEALDKLRNLDETRLLEISSKALAVAGGSGLALKITQPYHLMSLNLLLALDKTGKPVDMIRDSETRDKDKPSRSKRCTDLSGNKHNHCLGMCGMRCNCWKWVCGDCCWHRGCYQHDRCCAKKFWSKYCLSPWSYNFSCTRYGGYNKC